MTDYKLPVPGFKLISAEASNDQIQELIGMNFAIFTNTVLFVQNSRGRTVTDFLDEDDAGQKEIFSTLFNLQGYEQAGDLVIKDLRNRKTDLEVREQALQNLVFQLSLDSQTLKELESAKEQFEKNQTTEIERLQKEIQEVEATLKATALVSLEQQIQQLQLKIQEQEQKIALAQEQERESQASASSAKMTLAFKKDLWQKKKGTVFPILTPPKQPEGDLKLLEKEKGEIEEDSKTLLQFLKQKEQERDSFERNLKEVELEHNISQQRFSKVKQQQEQIETSRKSLQEKIKGIEVCPTCQQAFASEESKQIAIKDLYQRLEQLQDVDLKIYEQAVVKSLAKKKEVESTKFDPTEYQEIKAALEKNVSVLSSISDKIGMFQLYDKALIAYQADVKNQDSQIQGLEQELKTLQKEVVELEVQLPILQQKQEIDSKAQINLEEALKVSQSSLQDLNLAKERIAPLLSAQKSLNDTLCQVQQSVFPQQTWFAETEKKIALLNTQQLGSQKIITELKGTVQVLENLYQAFGKEGIVAELFREYIPDIQSIASDYLAELTNNELQIEFSSERILKKKVEGVSAVRNQFEIQVSKRNGGSGYDLISGSEQNKAALVVNWAVSDLAYQHSNVSCNVRIFDEIFDAIDAKGVERLALMILNRSKDSNQKTLVITHKQELEDFFERKILLRKENGISRLLEIT